MAKSVCITLSSEDEKFLNEHLELRPSALLRQRIDQIRLNRTNVFKEIEEAEACIEGLKEKINRMGVHMQETGVIDSFRKKESDRLAIDNHV